MQLAWKPSPLLLTPPAPNETSLLVSPRQRCMASVPAKASLVPPELESDRRQAEVLALRFAVGDAVECYIDGCFHRGTVVALSHRNDNVVPVCLSSFRAARLLALYHRSYFTHSHPHPDRDGRLVGWRRHRTRSCSTRAASSGHHPILMASSAQGAPGYRHRHAAPAAARHGRPIAAAAAAAAVAGAMPEAGAAIGAGAASAAPAALAAGTAAAVTVTVRAAAATVTVGRRRGASSATTPATASGTDRRSGRSGRRRDRRLWRRPCNRASLSSPLSKN